MNSRLLLVSCLACGLAQAQTPPPPGNPAAGAPDFEALRRAVRSVEVTPTNVAPARVVTGIPPAPAPAPEVPAPAAPPAPGAPAVPPAAPVPPAPVVPAHEVPAGPPGIPAPLTPAATEIPTASVPATPPAPTAPPAPATPPTTAASPSATPPSPGGPPAPGGPAAPGVAIRPAKPAAPDADEEVLPAGTINFPGVDINQVLQIYAELVNRTVLRPTTLPAPLITLKTQTPLTKREAIQAFDAVLAMNGIAMINIGDKFVKAVPQAQANQEGAPLYTGEYGALPELGPYTTHVVQLKYVKPTELVPVLQQFAKIPNSIMAIDSSQILVLRDYAENVKRMLEMIKEIDVTVPSEYISEVIPIKYALASEIASALSSLGGGGGATSVGSRPTTGIGGARPGTTTPGYRPGMTQPGMMTPGGVPGTTPGAATGAAQPSFTERLQSIIRRASASGEFQILGMTKIIADERTNSLLIFATRQDMEMIKDIISKLDVVLAQVLIEAVIMEVTLESGNSLGISYLQSPKSVGDFTGVGALKNTSSFLSPGSFGMSGLTNVAGNLPSGFSYFGRFNQDLDITLTAIANDSRINVLSRPRIQTSHAVPATLFIGNTVPYIQGTTFGDYGYAGARSYYQEKRVGISLDVLPLINAEGLVVMDISQNIQQLGTEKIIDGNPVPTTTERTATAKVAVRDRDTILLGGFISESKSKAKSGMPILKDIPLLGYLFRATSENNQRVELIVLLRPTVLPTPEVAALAARDAQSQMPAVRLGSAELRESEAKRNRQATKIEQRSRPQFEELPQ